MATRDALDGGTGDTVVAGPAGMTQQDQTRTSRAEAQRPASATTTRMGTSPATSKQHQTASPKSLLREASAPTTLRQSRVRRNPMPMLLLSTPSSGHAGVAASGVDQQRFTNRDDRPCPKLVFASHVRRLNCCREARVPDAFQAGRRRRAK